MMCRCLSHDHRSHSCVIPLSPSGLLCHPCAPSLSFSVEMRRGRVSEARSLSSIRCRRHKPAVTASELSVKPIPPAAVYSQGTGPYTFSDLDYACAQTDACWLQMLPCLFLCCCERVLITCRMCALAAQRRGKPMRRRCGRHCVCSLTREAHEAVRESGRPVVIPVPLYSRCNVDAVVFLRGLPAPDRPHPDAWSGTQTWDIS